LEKITYSIAASIFSIILIFVEINIVFGRMRFFTAIAENFRMIAKFHGKLLVVVILCWATGAIKTLLFFILNETNLFAAFKPEFWLIPVLDVIVAVFTAIMIFGLYLHIREELETKMEIQPQPEPGE